MMSLRQIFRRWRTAPRQTSDDQPGKVTAAKVGHRDFVGGLWNELGELQFEFLVGEGLQPRHVLLDIGCGSLRAGSHFVPYLNSGNYLGVDANADLIRAGVEDELGAAICELKKPQLATSDRFDFSGFDRQPDFALCQAVFMFVDDELIERCFANLRRIAKPSTRFFASYLQGRRAQRLELQKHPFFSYVHTRRQMLSFGAPYWSARYIGEWRHPRGQMMVEYRLR